MRRDKIKKTKQNIKSQGARGIVGATLRLFGMGRRYKSVILIGFIFLTFIFSTIYIIYRIALAPTVAPASDAVVIRVKSDYVLMLLQSVFGVAAMMLPGFLKRRANISIPNVMLITYAVFLYCAIYLGEVRNFYYTIPHWDTVLHTFSGAALGALGFSIVSLLNKSGSVTFSLSPAFVALFAFCFALSLGVIWEIYEFTMDSLLQTNMQMYAMENGTPYVGQAALVDTMKDLIVDALGAFTMAIIGYISLKDGKGWLDRFQVRISQNDELI